MKQINKKDTNQLLQTAHGSCSDSHSVCFGHFTVITTFPKTTLLKQIKSFPRYVFNIVKYKLCIPLCEKIQILLTSKSCSEKRTEANLKLFMEYLRDYLSYDLTYQLSSKNLNKESCRRRTCAIQFLKIDFTKQTLKYCESYIKQCGSEYGEKMNLIQGFIKTLSDPAGQSSELINRFARNLKRDALLNLSDVKIITSALRNLYDQAAVQLRKIYEHHASEWQSLTTTKGSKELHQKGYLKNKACLQNQHAFRNKYRELFQNDILPTDINLSQALGNQYDCITVPSSFTRHRPANYKTTIETPDEIITISSNIRDAQSQIIDKLRVLTNENDYASYSLCSHLNQSAFDCLSEAVSNSATSIFGMDITTNNDCQVRKTHIMYNPTNSREIVIIHTLSSALPPPTSSQSSRKKVKKIDEALCTAISTQPTGLSFYRPQWIKSSYDASMRITLNLDQPDRVVVEPFDVNFNLP